MVAKGILVFEWGNDTLTAALEALPKEAEAAVVEVVKDTTARATRIVKNKTPVDRGRLRQGWRAEVKGLTGRFVNTVAQANVAEFGGWPVTALSRSPKLRPGARIRGRAQLGGHKPGPRTTRAPGGTPSMFSNVSRQAPQGMVRITLKEIQPVFFFDLDEALENLPSWRS